MREDTHYTDAQLTTLIENFFRDEARPMPFMDIAALMGVRRTRNAMQRLVWGLVTGYSTEKSKARRKPPEWAYGYDCRRDYPWWPREDRALRHALAGKGQLREPKCDIAYIAAVLARTEEEVAERWAHLCKDPLGRAGFGVGVRA